MSHTLPRCCGQPEAQGLALLRLRPQTPRPLLLSLQDRDLGPPSTSPCCSHCLLCIYSHVCMSHTLPRCCGRRCLQGKRLPQRDCLGRHSPKLCSRLAAAPQRAKLQTAPLRHWHARTTSATSSSTSASCP